MKDNNNKSPQEYGAELFELMKANPELPVVPMVDADIIADDSGYWLGSWGYSRVDEYLLPPNDGPVLYKSDNDVFDVLERCLPGEVFEKLPEAEEDCRSHYEALPWTKAIIVYIQLPS